MAENFQLEISPQLRLSEKETIVGLKGLTLGFHFARGLVAIIAFVWVCICELFYVLQGVFVFAFKKLNYLYKYTLRKTNFIVVEFIGRISIICVEFSKWQEKGDSVIFLSYVKILA